MSNLLESLEKLALSVVEKEGFRLYDLEFNERQRKLIVTIDLPVIRASLSAPAYGSGNGSSSDPLKSTDDSQVMPESKVHEDSSVTKSSAITIEDCANVSRALNLLLDVENLIPGESSYDLEVSSPGLERDLKKLWHFEDSINKPVKVVIKKGYESESFGNLKSFKAVIDKVEGESIYFRDVENSKLKTIQVPFESIHRSNVVFEYGRVKKH